MRITLEVHRTLDLGASRTHHRLFLYRLLTRVRFRQARGWSDYHVAILDTGAPYSLLPLSLWPALRVERLTTLPLRGIVPGHTAELRADLARVSGRLLDARRVSPRLILWAMLARTDEVPLILGWAGCLDRARLGLDGRRRSAWLEF
ncbi:MAG: hypothetical protein HYT90_01675 [Candidatus Omnitrophica bacterium]|nr:hypothetical protein [Candidatus Omnitrophota bacterium]